MPAAEESATRVSPTALMGCVYSKIVITPRGKYFLLMWYSWLSWTYKCPSSWYTSYRDLYPTWSIANTAGTLPTLASPRRFQMYYVRQILNAAEILCHAGTCNTRIFTHNYQISTVISRGTCFHLGSQCSIWPAARVSKYHKLSSGASDSVLCALVFANFHSLHPYRVLLIQVANIQP
jgi:hypothetical protein